MLKHKLGIVRAVDGDGELGGRVEIYHHGEWGTVCDNDWDMKEATIVCRQLGFWDALEAKKGSFFGESDLPIVMNRVACKGTEGRLADCPFVCSSSPQCNSTNNAGVICKPSKGTLLFYAFACSMVSMGQLQALSHLADHT